MSNLKIAIPQNQGTVRNLMQAGGYEPVFEPGHPEPDGGRKQELNRGVIEKTGDTIIQIRSMDVLRQVAAGYRDIGFVGSDCIDEWPAWKVEKLAEFPFGRTRGSDQPRLEFVVPKSSRINNMREIELGTIFLTERPRLTAQFLKNLGFEVVIEKEDDSPREFEDKISQEEKVGIRIILGSGIPQLEPEKQVLVIVNEQGTTAKEYGVIVIGKIVDITTVLIANPDVLYDESKREQILLFREKLEKAYILSERELPRLSERDGASTEELKGIPFTQVESIIEPGSIGRRF
ncbi:MAG: hypothetical protein Q8P25_02325 [Candidatus Curtissbacteria bacterium]|nr:hypothetical protein [Candidatus Curtissbacteria bacterium]